MLNTKAAKTLMDDRNTNARNAPLVVIGKTMIEALDSIAMRGKWI
jgi:hypothetical protein